MPSPRFFPILLVSACLLTPLPGSITEDRSAAKAEIIRDIKTEAKAFAMRDYETWQKHWVQTDELRFAHSDAEKLSYIPGWETFNAGVQGEFKRPPSPSGDIPKYNYTITVRGDMAFVEYEFMIGEDPIRTFNVMIREGGVWKFLYMHQTNLNSYTDVEKPTEVAATESAPAE